MLYFIHKTLKVIKIYSQNTGQIKGLRALYLINKTSRFQNQINIHQFFSFHQLIEEKT